MPATIKIKNSSTASAVPTSSDLVQGELAVNVTDRRLFTENASGTVVELGTNPTILTMGAAGSASAPAITRTGDTNTGIFFPAADTIAFAEGGVEAMRLDSAGNMGLGVTPSSTIWSGDETRLVVKGAGTNFAGTIAVESKGTTNAVTGFLAASDSSNLLSVGAKTNTPLAFYTNFSERMRLDASGNLGLGTTSPASYGVIAAYKASGSASYIVGVNGGGCQTAIGVAGDNGSLLGTLTNHALRLVTNGNVQATIDSSGNLLVGTTSATNKRVVSLVGNSVSITGYYAESGSSYTGGHFLGASATAAGTGWYHFVGQSSGGTNNILIFGNGNVQNANNSYGAISDIKLKENITDASPKLEKLCQVRVVNYNLIGDYENHKQIGVIAQELETVFPSMVEESPDKDAEGNDLGTTTKSVKYSVFVPMLIKAIQELKAEFDAYKASHP